MRILIVEDYEPIAELLQKIISTSYQSDLCARIDDAKHLLEGGEYALLILDLGLEDGEGIELCRWLRRNNQSLPILVVSARFEEMSRIELLDAGADDYLLKPFMAGELMARIRVLMRRTLNNRNPLLGNTALSLDPARHQVIRRGEMVSLRRKEFSVLEYLMRHPGQVITRQRLLDQIWDYNGEITNNTVDVHIKYLRDRIDRPYGSSLIQTVHGLGYCFRPEAEPASERVP